MKLKSVSGIIYLVEDLEKTKKFYNTLGFEFRKEKPGISATAYLNWFSIEFLLSSQIVTDEFKEDVKVSPKGAGQYAHINVDNVDEFYDGLKAKGLKPSGQPEDRPWGSREFVIQDPDGYKLVIFEKK